MNIFVSLQTGYLQPKHIKWNIPTIKLRINPQKIMQKIIANELTLL